MNVGSFQSADATAALRTEGAEKPYGIVALSHLRWNFVWQRPQQFLSRFSETHPVLFIEEPEFVHEGGIEPALDLSHPQAGVTVATIRLPEAMRGNTELVHQTMLRKARLAIEAVNTTGQFDNPLLWVYSPMEAAWALGELPSRAVVYDCMDELSQFVGAPKNLVENERRLIAHTDVLFCGGYELWLKKSKAHSNCHFFGCGVEVDHFGQARDESGPIPEDVENLNGPVIGWFGVVDERVDYRLLGKVADLRPNYAFVVVGPVVKVDPATLPQRPNLYWLGGREYKDLPNYCRSFDVCVMPFALNEATQYINPTKALEYLATGRPVVSTPVADVVRQYSDTMQIATSPEDFALCLDRALENPDRTMIDKGIERAAESSWERTVARMREIISEAIETRDEVRGVRRPEGATEIVTA